MKQLLTTLVVITILMLSCKKEKKAPATVTTTAATNITSNSVSTGGNITSDGHSAITKRGVVYAIHAGATVADSITNDGTGSGSFTTNLTGLSSNTTYYIRAYAVNESGTAYGNEISITTAKGVPSVTTTAISNIQPLSAASGGNVINDGGATVTERGVVYGTTANPTINNFKIVSGTGTGTFTATLQPLASQQTYYVRAYATNSYGTAYGNQVQFNAASSNSIADADGNVYTYVTVCGITMTTTNLRTTKYRNGDAITDGSNANFNWVTSTNGAYTYPNFATDGTSHNAEYGKLYDLRAIRDSRGLCPTGWHIASDTNWVSIELCKGMDASEAYVGYGRFVPQAPDLLDGGSSGLNLKKGGEAFINSTGLASYSSFGSAAEYWTNTVSLNDNTQNIYRVFNRNDDPQTVLRSFLSAQRVISVRCVKD